MLRFIFLALLITPSLQGLIGKDLSKNHLKFTIDKTWNGDTVKPEDRITLSLEGVSDHSQDVKLSLNATYYNDPAPNGKAGEPFYFLWRFQVVELYFLNDKGHYMKVILGPNGQHLVALHNGTRNKILFGLPLKYTSEIEGSTWTGSAIIPGDYFPSQVTKFNAAAIHGVEPDREYLQLYPGGNETTEPDFHVLSTFQSIKMSVLSSAFTKNTHSNLWESALTGSIPFTIRKTWEGRIVPKDQHVDVILSKANDEGVIVKVKAPFYDNPSSPSPPGQPTFELWKYENVEVYFLNNDDQYLQVQITPQGHYFTLFLNGYRNCISQNLDLPLNVTTEIQGNTWTAEVFIPREYFPPEVTKFNAAAQHDVQNERRYLTLSPNVDKPDFHNIWFYQPLLLGNFFFDIITDKTNTLSPIWNEALRHEFDYTIKYKLRGEVVPENKRVHITLHPIPKSKDVAVHIKAPFYNRPPPGKPVGSLFINLTYYEEVEVLFRNEEGEYLQVMLGPHGHYSVYLFNGYRNLIGFGLPLNSSTTIQESTWTGKITIPYGYLPKQVSQFNAGSSSLQGKDREFLSRKYSTLLDKQDFHDKGQFRTIRLDHLIPNIHNSPMSAVWKHALNREFHFTIKSTWDGRPIPAQEHVIVTVKKLEHTKDVFVKIESPFYDDPANIDEPLHHLWKYEVPSPSWVTLPGTEVPNVTAHWFLGTRKPPSHIKAATSGVAEVYFLNDKNMYLEIQFTPHNQYSVIFFNGKRNVINRAVLPLNVTTKIEEGKWTAEAVIPGDYFPPRVRKFNAAAMHGTGANRRYLSLSSNPEASSKPEFHDLEFFKNLDMRIAPKWKFENDRALSSVWEKSLLGEYRRLFFTIEKTWNGKLIPENEKTKLVLFPGEKPGDVRIGVNAPYYDDPLPDSPVGYFRNIWKFEEVEVMFLNEKDEYLQIHIGPHGHYSSFLIVRVKSNKIKEGLPLNVTTQITDNRWQGDVVIPADYLPPMLTKFNAFAMHGDGPNRRFYALYPANSTETKPDFHKLEYFRYIDMVLLRKRVKEYSPVWASALNIASDTNQT